MKKVLEEARQSLRRTHHKEINVLLHGYKRWLKKYGITDLTIIEMVCLMYVEAASNGYKLGNNHMKEMLEHAFVQEVI